jgi:hypothetical protein
MQLRKKIVWVLGLVWGVTIPVLANEISVSSLDHAAEISRDRQLREFQQAFQPGTNGYFALGVHYLPFPTQSALSSEYGTHEGFAFRHTMAAYFANPIANSGVDIGLLWWVERQGWDQEDFFILPDYGEFALVRSIQTAGMSFAFPKHRLGLAGGIQYQNVEKAAPVYADESDSLYWWGHGLWGPTAVQTSFQGNEWRHVRISLNLESKEIWGGVSHGITTYFPNFDVALFNGDDDDSVRIALEQNLWAQNLYAEVVVFYPEHGFRSAALKYYPDPSRIISLDATCYRLDDGDLVWGGGITLPFLRLGYNHASDIENFFGSRGTFMIELRFALSAMKDQFFGLGAAKSAPMNSERVKKSLWDKTKKTSDTEKKELTAKGIRREKSK